VHVSPPALAPLGDHLAHVRLVQVEQELVGVRREDLRADRHAAHEILAAAPVAVLAHPVLAVGRLQRVRVRQIEQRRQARISQHDPVAAVAAVAARRAAERHELLAPERDRPVAAASGDDADVALIHEFHGRGHSLLQLLRDIDVSGSNDGSAEPRQRDDPAWPAQGRIARREAPKRPAIMLPRTNVAPDSPAVPLPRFERNGVPTGT